MRGAKRTSSSRRKKSFHHGNLHDALVSRARAVLRKEGVAALSLREIARQERVSHAAAYRHFASRAALLAAVATLGFVELRERLERAVAEAGGATEELSAIGRAYVRFAIDEPHLFRLMYGGDVVRSEHPELEAAARATFGVVLTSVLAAQDANAVRREPALELALVAWSLAHGVAILSLDAQLVEAGIVDAEAEKFIERAERVLRRGLAP
jgi:AcrR family transcriptional regulator